MASPVGHAVIGEAVGIAFLLGHSSSWKILLQEMKARWRVWLLIAVYANLPDLDFIPGLIAGDLNLYHHGLTHTLGWIVMVSFCSWMIWYAFSRKIRGREYFLLFFILFSHLLVDWVTADGKTPYGIMFLWPFSKQYYISPVALFPHLKKSGFAELFDVYNLKIMTVEFLRSIPVLLAVIIYKRYGKARQSSQPLQERLS